MARKLGMDDTSLTEDDEARLLELHQQTMTALQIVLVTGAFSPGQYRLRDIYDRRSWERVSP
jgi:molybdopterin biosynthesis enzyme